MTATPKVYGSAVADRAEREGIRLFGMDDPTIYGKELFKYSFGQAVDDGILCEYRVRIFVAKRDALHRVWRDVIGYLESEEKDFTIGLPDIGKMHAIYDAITSSRAGKSDPSPLQRAMFFVNTIEKSKNVIKETFPEAINRMDKESKIKVNVRHVDGNMGANERNKNISWLKSPVPKGEIRAISNVRCLSEGVDVPDLDGVVFYDPRKSQVDIIQALGRVMRKPASGSKQFGHVILPVCIPEGANPENLLRGTEYKHIWSVLQALKSHDERLSREISRLNLGNKGALPERYEIKISSSGNESKNEAKAAEDNVSQGLLFESLSEELMNAIKPIFVDKLGDRHFLKSWAKDVGEITKQLIGAIEKIVSEKSRSDFSAKFENYVSGLHSILGQNVGKKVAVEMLAQHIITKPIFDALFDGYKFGSENPISQVMNQVEDEIKKIGLYKGEDTLAEFYSDIPKRVEGLNDLSARRAVLENLYADFFQEAFKDTAESSGIVYTPVEAVDFILHGINAVSRKHLGLDITNKGVSVLDPFAGCGRFIVRLMESGIIEDADLERKYESEIHANEKLLLPYYISTVNIEQAYKERMDKYMPFKKGLLTNTFKLDSPEKPIINRPIQKGLFSKISQGIALQEKETIRVICTNPPYFAAGDASYAGGSRTEKLGAYKILDASIEETFKKNSLAKKNTLTDYAIRSLRWSMDRISKTGGVVGFITNGSFLRDKGFDGVRKSIASEMSAAYILDLRGGIKKTMGDSDASTREGGNVFANKCMLPICIIIMVKSSKRDQNFKLYYKDVGDYLSTEDKLSFLGRHGSDGKFVKIKWKEVHNPEDGYWFSKPHSDFEKFLPLGNDKVKKNTLAFREEEEELENALFDLYSMGVAGRRDAWACNFSRKQLEMNMKKSADFYNSEIDRMYAHEKASGISLKKGKWKFNVDKKQIKWGRALQRFAEQRRRAEFQKQSIRNYSYRPFSILHFYYDKIMQEELCRTAEIFGGAGSAKENHSICVSNSSNLWGVLATKHTPDGAFLHGSPQILPFYSHIGDKARENINDRALELFQSYYGNDVTKWDIFYYVYGVLNHPEYRKQFATDLMYKLATIPFVKKKHFSGFMKAGKNLMNLHIEYESADEYALKRIASNGGMLTGKHAEIPETPRSEGMRLKRDSDGIKSILKFNDSLYLRIPKEAHAYTVCGRSPIEWVAARYRRKVDEDSGIVNDPNDWGEERGDPGYILSLVKKAVTVGIQSAEIISSLPPLEYDAGDQPRSKPAK